MIPFPQVLEKIQKKDYTFVDSKGDNLLHSLIEAEKTQTIPIEPVETLLKHHPELVNIPTSKGLSITQLLENAQSHDKVINRPLHRLLTRYISDNTQRQILERGAYISFIEQLPGGSKKSDSPDYKRLSVEESKNHLTHPCLLLFGGIESFTLPLITSTGRCIRKSLGIYSTPTPGVKILSARYPGNNEDICNDYKFYHNQLEKEQKKAVDSPEHYIKYFVTQYLRPLYLDTENHPLPMDKIIKNLRNLNLIGYSYGAHIIQEILNKMEHDLQEHHFTKSDIQKIQSQIFAFTIGPDLTPTHYQTNARTYHLLNTMDDVVGQNVLSLIQPVHLDGKNDALTHLKEQPNQKVFLIHTLENNTSYEKHELNTYLNPVNPTQKKAIMWMKALVFNAINNSIQNQMGEKFIPLPQNLEEAPKNLLWLKNIPTDFHYKHKKTLTRPKPRKRVTFLR